jgi:hypothetical protein
MNRSICVICNNPLTHILTRENTPITFSPAISPYTNDIFSEQKFGLCNTCGCVQLITLIEPSTLYSSPHNGTFSTAMWKNHHQEFFEFICEHNISEHILEIGGNPHILYPKFQEKLTSLTYKCLDICIPTRDISGITYIEGNCEKYTYSAEYDIVLSHVFEHLYNPCEFVKCLQRDRVNKVYISIPNLNELLNNKSPVVITNEHTYFINDTLIRYMFNNCGYICKGFKEFCKHSYFYYFEKTNIPILYDIPKLYITEKILDIYKPKQIDTPFGKSEHEFIAPAGHYGQYIYNIFYPKNIIGFLDNDIYKQGKRVYGTPYSTYSYNKLLSYDNPHVYVYAGPYSDEIIKQLEQYSNCTIHKIVI